MKAEEKKQTANTLMERSVWMMIGILPIHIKPLTLGQIYEMGEYTCELDGESIRYGEKTIASAQMFKHYKDAKVMQEVFLICAFRKRWLRSIFRKYILHRLTVFKYQKALEVMINAFQANFFLTSIIFLSQTNRISEPN